MRETKAGNGAENHRQWLKKFGREKVHDQITKVINIMKLWRILYLLKNRLESIPET